jgi:hypothetical protein
MTLHQACPANELVSGIFRAVDIWYTIQLTEAREQAGRA